MRTILAALMVLFISALSFAQVPEPDQTTTIKNPITREQVLELPRTDRKPKITLQRALKIAERYIKTEKLTISSYYLFEARLIFSEDGAESHWQFWWVRVNGLSVKDIKIAVSMNGNPQMLSSP